MRASRGLVSIGFSGLLAGTVACTVVDAAPEQTAVTPSSSVEARAEVNRAADGVDTMDVRPGEVTLTVALSSTAVREGSIKLGDSVRVCALSRPAARLRLVAAFCRDTEAVCTGLAATSAAAASLLLASGPAGSPLTVGESCS